MKKQDLFKIYADRLKKDDVEEIHEVIDNNFIDIEEEELVFIGQTKIAGQAYLTTSHLVLALKVKALAKIPCSICNEKTETPIEINDFSYAVALSEIKSGVYDYSEEIRTAILLKVPPFVECHQGHCPHRKEVNKYFKETEETTYTPFSHLKYEESS